MIYFIILKLGMCLTHYPVVYPAGYPARYPVTGYPVSGENFGRILNIRIPKYIKILINFSIFYSKKILTSSTYLLEKLENCNKIFIIL